MWSRSIVLVTLVGCAPPPAPPPAPVPVPEPPAEVVEPEPPAEVTEPEPPAEVTETPPPPKPAPEPEVVCAELDERTCMVTEGCEWHTIKKCLQQEKPKTLGD